MKLWKPHRKMALAGDDSGASQSIHWTEFFHKFGFMDGNDVRVADPLARDILVDLMNEHLFPPAVRAVGVDVATIHNPLWIQVVRGIKGQLPDLKTLKGILEEQPGFEEAFNQWSRVIVDDDIPDEDEPRMDSLIREAYIEAMKRLGIRDRGELKAWADTKRDLPDPMVQELSSIMLRIRNGEISEENGEEALARIVEARTAEIPETFIPELMPWGLVRVALDPASTFPTRRT